MKKEIDVILLYEAEVFMEQIETSARRKLFYAIRKVKSGMVGSWFKKIHGSKGIFEFRVKDSNKYFRLFAFWDRTGDAETLIVCTHGLIKKTAKTPLREIRRSEAIKGKYLMGL